MNNNEAMPSGRCFPGFGRWQRRLAVCLALLLAGLGAERAQADPTFDTANPLGFFTNVASRLVSQELHLNLWRLPVYPTNNYTPSVQRLLQVTANIYDATTTNFYPSVFRPVFSTDATGTNLFITGYELVTNVTTLGTGQVSAPIDPAAVATVFGPLTNQAVNVYGLPWIIGARKGLPNFNQFASLNTVQVTRKLQFSRPSVTAPVGEFVTNQLYVLSVSNTFAINFWNSYSNAYPRPVQIFGQETLGMALTAANGNRFGASMSYYSFNTNIASWPGSAWNLSLQPKSRTPAAASFVSLSGNYPLIAPSAFWPSMQTFASGTNLFDPGSIVPLPALQLTTTNWIWAVMLDGGHVIDWVQIEGPITTTNVTTALADVYPAPLGQNNTDGYVWATNRTSNGAIYGIGQQWAISVGLATIPNGSYWLPGSDFPQASITAQQVYFEAFFTGNTAINSELSIQAPYAPTRTLFCPFLFQANDPLVHYLASDLNGSPGEFATWANNLTYPNGTWVQDDNLSASPLPLPLLTALTSRYQPWGVSKQMMILGNQVDTNACNLAFRDPDVFGSDYWNFPTNQTWNLNWLGQVHRGTPWQTVYLKSQDVLGETKAGSNIGTNTWMAWTGNANAPDAIQSRPVMDWQLVDVLAQLLNTNNLNSQFSVNNPNPAAWTSQMDGFNVASNTWPDIQALFGVSLPTFNVQVVSSNDAQAAVVANAIVVARAGQPGGNFSGVGEILAVPQLSQQSPYLNWNDADQQLYGLTDAEYESIPSQLLPLLRVDPVGTLTGTNGQWQVQFSGYDGHVYAVQSSTDLVHWTSIATNAPVNGTYTQPVTPGGNAGAVFYRSQLAQ